MAVNNRTYLRVLTDASDNTGASEFSVAAENSAIGGGGVDEHEILVDDATHAYTTHNRAVLSEDFRHGDGASQADLFETSSTTYVTALLAVAEAQEDRGAVAVVVSYRGRARVSILNRAGGVIDGPTQGADSPTSITTATISLDAGSTEQIVIKVELKKTDATDSGKLFGYRVLEDQTPATTTTHADFLALDSDCLSSAAGRAGAAPWYQQIERNVRAGESSRRRRCGKAFAADNRPVLAGAAQMAWPLFVWLVPDKPRPRLSLTIHGLCTGDGAGGHAVTARLALQDKGGRVFDSGTATPINDDSGKQFVTLTSERAGALRGEAVTAWLAVSSEDVGSAVGATDLDMTTRLVTGGRRLSFDATLAAAYDASKRWRLTFAQDSSGTYSELDTGYPDTTMVIKDDLSDIKRLFPGLRPDLDDDYPALRVALQEIGRFELYGYCWAEDYTTQSEALAPWRPYKPPFAVNFRALYGRIWRQASKAERICHAGGTGDVSDRLPAARGQWGSWRQYNGAADVDLGAALAGSVPQYKINTTSATTKYRRRYRVAAAILPITSSDSGFAGFTLKLKAALASFASGVWSTTTVAVDVEGGARVVVPMRAPAAYGVQPLSGEILWTSQDHKLAGAWLWADVQRGRDNLVIIEGSFEDSTAGAAAASRLLRLQAELSGDFPGDGGTLVALAVYCACFTVAIDDGF